MSLRKTKIVATIGPASDEPVAVEKMISSSRATSCSSMTASSSSRSSAWKARTCIVAFSSGASCGPVIVPRTMDWTSFVRDWVGAEALPGRVALLVRGPSRASRHANHGIEILQLAGAA